MSSTQDRGGRSDGGNSFHAGRGGGRMPSRKYGDSRESAKFRGLIEGLPTLDYGTNGVAPEVVEKFFEAMKDYCMAHYIKGLEKVFDREGDYPIFEEPEMPDDPNDRAAFEIWKEVRKYYRKNAEQLMEDIVKMFGVVNGQCSMASKDRYKQTELGVHAAEEICVRDLARAIRATHHVGSRQDDTDNFYNSLKSYNNIKMGEHEGLGVYFNRFTATLLAITEAARRAEKEGMLPDDELKAMHFVNTLAPTKHSEFIKSVERNMVGKPADLQAAYEAAVVFGPNSREYGRHESARRVGAFVAKGGRGGDRRGSGGGRGSCHKCGSRDHWQRDCPDGKADKDKADINKAIAQVNSDKQNENGSSKSSGGKKANKKG